MTPEQRAAYIHAMAVLAFIESQILLAEDRERVIVQQTPANGPEQWSAFHKKWEAIIGHNAIISYFQA